MSSPLNWPTPESAADDCLTFRYFLADIIRQHLPCTEVEVLPEISGDSLPPGFSDSSLEILAHIRKKGKPVVDHDTSQLFLPLHIENHHFATAVLEGGDPDLYQKYTIKALFDSARAVTADYLALRMRGVDPLTGLFNSTLWQETVELRLSEEKSFCLVLLEIYPRIRDAAHAYAYLKRAAGALDSMTGMEMVVFHLGSGVFGMLWEEISVVEARNMADVILYRLQRDGISRAHLGQVWCGDDIQGFAEAMDRAWKVVVKARQRGPFAKAVWMGEEELLHHPFRSLTSGELNRFKDAWQGYDHFCLATLQPDTDDGTFADLLRDQVGSKVIIVERESGEIYLFCGGMNLAQGRAEIEQLQEQLAGISFSAGLADFPCLDYKRSAVVLNSRKALQHTFFFGPGSITVFDAVSLNISGDVYYNEGDMNGAVREYLQGLELDAANVNLLNSLGVAYIRLNRYKTAIACFERALALDPDNYMALLNQGSAWLTLGRDELAVEFFEKALAVDGSIYDLYLQLAELYCRAGSFEKVVELLATGGDAPDRCEEWEEASALRCLGEAWRNLGENQQAMECLQKASAYNHRDSRALSLLGEVYDLAQQGSEIALALCHEAVELDDEKWDNWLRLGLVQGRNGRQQDALASLQRSLKLNRHNIQAARMLKKLYEDGGKKRLAERMASKIGKISKDM